MKIAIIKLPKYTINLALKTPISWKETGGTSDSEKSKQESKNLFSWQVVKLGNNVDLSHNQNDVGRQGHSQIGVNHYHL